MTMSRRELFGWLRRPALVAEAARPPPAPTAPPAAAPSVLDRFYDARTRARELPRFTVRTAGPAATTRIGAGPTIAAARSASPVAQPADPEVPQRDAAELTTQPPTPRSALHDAPRVVPDGLVPRVIASACLAATTSCSVCVERCPVPGAIAVADHRPRVVAARCTGCGICIQRCPAPVLAFELEPRGPA
jgi:Pyruvate/2-oxoacid:ferredoxin oxidoreductase delta subunit